MIARAFAFALAAGTVLSLAACDDMYEQGKLDTWDRADFLRKKTSMQLPVPNTVPRDEPNLPVPAPKTITVALLERGHRQFNIFCTPCHGLTGLGDGMVVQRGFPKPPSFIGKRLISIKAQQIYDVIEHGKGAMYSYADRVPPADRWAIAAYIRALQLSQKPVLADLPPDAQTKLNEDAP